MAETKIFVGMILGGKPGLYLPYAIEAVYKIVDYFVINDTGITDGSLDKILQVQDPDKKIHVIKTAWANRYDESRNTYLKYFRDRLYQPSHDVDTYYWRIDSDECYSGNLPYLRDYLAKFRHQSAFRFHFSTFDSSHFTLNEVNPQETRANLFRYNPAFKYEGSIHEMPYYIGGGHKQVLYGDEPFDQDLGIQMVPADVAHYLHFSYCDEQATMKKMFNYTEQYVKQGTVTPEKLQALRDGDNWAFRDHQSKLKFTGVYPAILKTAPFLQDPPWPILFDDGTKIEAVVASAKV